MHTSALSCILQTAAEGWHEGRAGGEPYSALLQEPEHDYEVCFGVGAKPQSTPTVVCCYSSHLLLQKRSSSAFEQQVYCITPAPSTKAPQAVFQPDPQTWM